MTLGEQRASAQDGATKLLFRTSSGARLESVLLRIASGRTSLCLSIQTRCPVACRFCASGTLGKVDSLHVDEVLDQVVQARALLRLEDRELRNLVFMGMGEPLLEEDLLHECLARLTAPAGFGFPENRLLVSTVGFPDGMRRLAERFPGVRQALSLHAAREEVRCELIPAARSVSLRALREAVLEVGRITGGPVMIEYLLLAGVNDRPGDEAALLAWLEGLPVLLNLIPFNAPGSLGASHSVDSRLRPTPLEQGRDMAQRFRERGIRTTLRHSLGQDISAACGQLAVSPREGPH